MADQSQPSALIIPPDIQSKFGAIIALILGSESMNNEERQYWINILPVMTPEQLKNLEEILTSEKKQLADIDAKYAKKMPEKAPVSVAEISQKIRSKSEKRQVTEQEDSQKEELHEEEILSQIQSL